MKAWRKAVILLLRAALRATAPDALRRNEIAAIQRDRVYQRHTFDVPFFSRPTNFPRGPFLLSQVSGAPVLPVFVIRRGWLRYHTLMGDLIPAVPSRVTCGDDDAALCEAMCQAVGFLEKTLTTHYDQWMNFFDFWPVASRTDPWKRRGFDPDPTVYCTNRDCNCKAAFRRGRFGSASFHKSSSGASVCRALSARPRS
jgi:Bacterial lipid A biosynthesis acyltransferase